VQVWASGVEVERAAQRRRDATDGAARGAQGKAYAANRTHLFAGRSDRWLLSYILNCIELFDVRGGSLQQGGLCVPLACAKIHWHVRQEYEFAVAIDSHRRMDRQ
jgi:hypothetical protein